MIGAFPFQASKAGYRSYDWMSLSAQILPQLLLRLQRCNLYCQCPDNFDWMLFALVVLIHASTFASNILSGTLPPQGEPYTFLCARLHFALKRICSCASVMLIVQVCTK